MSLFNVWADGHRSKTTVIADTSSEALDCFCARHGFDDYADYCTTEEFQNTKINIEEVTA